jgi:DNA uptake protein ComE-like DNA-binding protein
MIQSALSPFLRVVFRSLRTFCLLVVPWGTVRAADPLQDLPGARLVSAEWADGDSFPVAFPDPATGEARTEVFRLYAVDCLETTVGRESDRRRLLEQARHFGVEDAGKLPAEGRKATAFVAGRLAKPFTVQTAFAVAEGRSGRPRYYAFVTTASGEDLGEALVAAGLARVKGLTRERAPGVPGAEYAARLTDRELTAALHRAGIWRLSNPDRLAALRETKRREERELAAITERAPGKVDVNTASAEELEKLPGIGGSLAARIIAGRPYRSPDDLLRIKGIGPATVSKLRPLLAEPSPDGNG